MRVVTTVDIVRRLVLAPRAPVSRAIVLHVVNVDRLAEPHVIGVVVVVRPVVRKSVVEPEHDGGRGGPAGPAFLYDSGRGQQMAGDSLRNGKDNNQTNQNDDP